MLHSTLRCFADNTRICSDSHNITELQSDLDEVTKWSSRNNMVLHDDKFEYICHLANKEYCSPLWNLAKVYDIQECTLYKELSLQRSMVYSISIIGIV